MDRTDNNRQQAPPTIPELIEHISELTAAYMDDLNSALQDLLIKIMQDAE